MERIAIAPRDGLLCLFGLGVSFQELYGQLVLVLGREPDVLCDNDPDRWGREFFGKRCVSPAELAGAGRCTTVVITVRRYEGIQTQLAGLGIERIYLACFDRSYEMVRAIKELGVPNADTVRAVEPLLTSVQGRWTLVTGASRGIGRQIALEMARLGSNIVTHSRALVHTKDVAATCVSYGVQVVQTAADMSNLEQMERWLDELASDAPPVDIVFNNAGISCYCSDPWDIDSQQYLSHYTVNTVAPVRICYRLLPGMKERGFGRVVNVTSTIQKRPGELAYALSKAALTKYVHDLSPSLEGTGVMMSLVCPGHVRSDMGGVGAPHGVESVIPGVLLGALLSSNVNGRQFIAQDFAGLDLPAAALKAGFYYY